MFRLAGEQLERRCIGPQRCLFVGDTFVNDVALLYKAVSPRSASIRTVLAEEMITTTSGPSST